MLKVIKKKIKEIDTWCWNILFKNVKHYPFLKYYPKGRNHLYDIMIEEKTNDDYIVFDIGANVGQTVKFYNNILNEPKIYSFEPVAGTFEQLLKNDFKSNITCFNFALGAKEDNIEINISNDSGLNSLVKEENSSFKTGKTEKIEIKTVDDVCKSLNIDKIDILKIDTEGYDLEVLYGAKSILSNKKVKYVFCEIGFNYEPCKGNFYEINKFLRKNNFWLCGFYDVSRWGDNYTYFSFCNALFKLVE